MSECTHDCSTCSANCASREKQSMIEKPHRLSNIKKVVAVMSGKGGVGKSLVTSLLAVLASRAGYKTAILDADITGPSIPKAFGIKEKAMGNDEGILPVESRTGIKMMSVNLLLEEDNTPVVWRGPVIAGTVKQFWTDVLWGDIDIMFIDMPPGTGDVPLTVFQSVPVDDAIVVTSPQALVGMIVEKALNMANMMDIKVLGLVENMSYALCPDCGKHVEVFGESHVQETAERFGTEVLAKLPINLKLAAACDAGLIELFEGDWLDDAIRKVLQGLED
ncbi:MAG: Mrp/NBP35 family ATP-binding protein [Clostridia bacterium]|nr:Mrp/NBP35 family ATP-binding protein [Clostridia bacterium]MBR6810600.1 Mrp/NBP35 family ATP-binding protein [Clostridia bacterium]